ncbi:MAG: hypothetical protein H0X70_06540 [Segetibacter sp.]|jgi:hypothetical protein|nr:hypothetical protein [Segetibacter sp.]
MKKIIAVSILTILGYGFTYSSECRLCKAATFHKYENKNGNGLSADQNEDEMSFHPLMFVRIPFK